MHIHYTSVVFLRDLYIGYNSHMYTRWEVPKKNRTIKKWLQWLKKAKTWQLTLVLILLCLPTATFLRMNNLEMDERRDAVIAADKTGDAAQIQRSILLLQKYVSHHMNTSLGKGIDLKESYNRDREVAIQKAAQQGNPQSEAYQKASIECRARWQGSAASFRNDYVKCVEDAVANLPSQQQTELELPRAAAYRYNFASPVLSFDIAGLFVILCLIIFMLIVTRLLLFYTLKSILLIRKKSL